MSKKRTKGNKKEIILPISKRKVFVSESIDLNMFFSSLVAAFTLLDLAQEKWESLGEEERETVVDDLINKSIDYLVSAGVIWAPKTIMQQIGKEVLDEAQVVGQSAELDLVAILKENKSLLKRNIMQKVLGDRNDKYSLWATILDSVDGARSLGDESIIQKALNEAMS